jgi:hypothetical protein
LLLVSILGTASYGYLVNNLFDLEEDRRAGKSNYVESISVFAKASMVVIFLFIALFPWLFLPVLILNFGLFILQLVLLTAYCLPPVRLKRFVCAGVITDALYNSVIMVFVIVFTIREYAVYPLELGTQVLAVLFVVLFLKGLRGILLHQLADRKNDRKAGFRSYVLHRGSLFTIHLISKAILIPELVSLSLLVFLLTKHVPGLGWMYLSFMIYSFLRLRLWNIRTIPVKQYKFIFLYTLNDFYEEWLPLYSLLLLAIQDIRFLFLFVPYVLFFPAFFNKLSKDVPGTMANFKNDLKKKFLSI